MMTLPFVVFLNCICIGILTGFVSDLTYFVKRMFKNNFIINNAIDFFVFFIGATLIYIVSIRINDGIFAIYELLGFVSGVVLEKKSCSNLIAKLFDMLYNNFENLKNKIKQTKLGAKLTK